MVGWVEIKEFLLETPNLAGGYSLGSFYVANIDVSGEPYQIFVDLIET